MDLDESEYCIISLDINMNEKNETENKLRRYKQGGNLI